MTPQAAILETSSALSEISTQELHRELIRRLGEDPERDGLRRTPERMEKSMAFLTRGYEQTVQEVLHNALFDVDYDEMVIVKDIEFYSLCEHHMLPFYGKAHVAYVPNGKVIGLSKMARLVDVFARAPAGTGAPNAADFRCDRRSYSPSGRRCHPGSSAPLHDDARRGKAALADCYECDAGGF